MTRGFPYNNGLLEAYETLPGWIAVAWLYPGKARKTALRTLREIEDMVRANRYKGWLAYSEWRYENMHKFLIRFGCFPYASDARNIYFKKEVN